MSPEGAVSGWRTTRRSDGSLARERRVLPSTRRLTQQTLRRKRCSHPQGSAYVEPVMLHIQTISPAAAENVGASSTSRRRAAGRAAPSITASVKRLTSDARSELSSIGSSIGRSAAAGAEQRSVPECAGMSLDEDEWLRSDAEAEGFLRSVAPGS